MRHLMLLSILGLLGLSACSEWGWVPETEMQAVSDGNRYGGRGY